MKLSSIFRSVVTKLQQAVEARPPPPPAQPAVIRDRFEGPGKPAPVDLGAPKNTGDAEYVRGLYKELLGREPDAGGMAAHLKGLETGMTRDQIRDVFLTSPEFQGKQAGGVGGGGGGAVGGLTPTPLKTTEDPGTVSYVNSPQNKNVAPRSSFMDGVNAAIDRVQAKGIGVDPSNPTRITDFDTYHQGVMQELLAAGYKANYDGEEMAVSRPGDKHSEQFDISTWKGEVRRFYASWQQPTTFAE